MLNFGIVRLFVFSSFLDFLINHFCLIFLVTFHGVFFFFFFFDNLHGVFLNHVFGGVVIIKPQKKNIVLDLLT